MCRLHFVALNTENRARSGALRSCGECDTPVHHQRDSRHPIQENPGSFWQVKARKITHSHQVILPSIAQILLSHPEVLSEYRRAHSKEGWLAAVAGWFPKKQALRCGLQCRIVTRECTWEPGLWARYEVGL